MKQVFFIFVFIDFLFAYKYPYALDKFHDILHKVKLQAPNSSYNAKYSCKNGKFDKFSNRYFYLQNGRYMTFQMCGYKNRSELREVKDWYVSSKNKIKIIAKILIEPMQNIKEFTFLQIHSEFNFNKIINKPLLRIVWRKKYKDKKSHIWAIIRKSIKKHKYQKIDLGKSSQNFFRITIKIKNNILSIFKNNQKISQTNVKYWKKIPSYFKAGVYLQSKGCAKVLFDTIYIVR